MAVVERRARGMASEVHVVLVGAGDHLADAAVTRLRQLEDRWSRFLDTSDITRLNHSPGVTVPVDRSTIVLIDAMVDGWVRTAGRYDPTLMPELLDAGYTASVDDPSCSAPRPAARRSEPWLLLDIEVDAERATVTLPPGVSLDPGGIGKGLAADLVVAELLELGAGGAMVSIGGDLRADGCPPDDSGWYVVVEDPLDHERDLVTLVVDGGGICTSSTRSRRWVERGSERHHLIDPRTGQVSTTDLAAVTVVAERAALAEVHATAALLLGLDGAIADLDSSGLAGIVTATTGETRVSSAVQRASAARRTSGVPA